MDRRAQPRPNASTTCSSSFVTDDLLTDLLQATGTSHGYSLRLLGRTYRPHPAFETEAALLRPSFNTARVCHHANCHAKRRFPLPTIRTCMLHALPLTARNAAAHKASKRGVKGGCNKHTQCRQTTFKHDFPHCEILGVLLLRKESKQVSAARSYRPW